MAKVKAVFKAEANGSYFQRVTDAIYEALEQAVDNVLAHGVKVAKKHAPVRKVTRRGGRVQKRDLTDDEIAELPDFVKGGLNPLTGNTFIRTGKRPQTTVKRSLAGAQEPRLRIKGRTYRTGKTAREVRLNNQTGRYELRNPKVKQFLNADGQRALEDGTGVYTRRIAYTERTKVRNPRTGKMETRERIRRGYISTIGGRLRGEIRADFLGVENGVVRGELVSPTEYARFVEFPTSRTAAQPYMRPARSAMEARLVPEIEAAISRVSRATGG